jgi:hypothetical protein
MWVEVMRILVKLDHEKYAATGTIVAHEPEIADLFAKPDGTRDHALRIWEGEGGAIDYPIGARVRLAA